MRRNEGFTLLEILAALLVVALALTAAVKLAAGTAANTAYLRDKSHAHWVALNVIAEQRLRSPWPRPGGISGEQRMGHRDWPWRAEVEQTPNEDIRRISVTVDNDEVQLVLTGYLLRPPEAVR
jgi:general secretion pathway protein I